MTMIHQKRVIIAINSRGNRFQYWLTKLNKQTNTRCPLPVFTRYCILSKRQQLPTFYRPFMPDSGCVTVIILALIKWHVSSFEMFSYRFNTL